MPRAMREEPDAVETGDVRLTWDPTLGVARMSFTGPSAREQDARVCIDALRRWSGDSPLDVLVDCTNIRDTEPGWRASFAEYFRHERPDVRLAWFNMSPLISMMVQMFIRAAGVKGKGFRSEAEARAWLGTPAEARSR